MLFKLLSRQSFRILLLCFGVLCVMVVSVLGSSPDACRYQAEAYQDLNLTQLSQELEGTGLIGRIHGANAPAGLFVLSVREAGNFFNHREFSLFAEDETTQAGLSEVHRHDQVCIQGTFIANPSPQKHILVKSVRVLDAWLGRKELAPYEREVDLPADLLHRTSFVGKIHAIGESGKVLVVEYRDGVIPIFVEVPEYTQGLFRGDIVRIAYRLQAWPQKPAHLKLNLEMKQPLEVIDAIASWHGQPKTLSGPLVKFPQSPQLKFDVYAIEVETAGVKRYFTLLNFEDMDTFKAIREKLANIWERHADTATSGRNMLINPQTIIEATGRANILSPAQANPQILLDTADDLRLKLVSKAG